MASRITHIEIDAAEPAGVAAFWAALLGWSTPDFGGGRASVRPPAHDGCPWDLVFLRETEVKRRKNRLHLDLASESPEHQAALVTRARELGARPADIGQGEADVPWVVLADPGGNEFCVLEPRAEYRDSGALAALVVDSEDAPALARFWSAITGWTIEHTSADYAGLRAPGGRGPWLEFVRNPDPRQGRNRLRPVLVSGDEGALPSADPEGNDIVLGSDVSPDSPGFPDS